GGPAPGPAGNRPPLPPRAWLGASAPAHAAPAGVLPAADRPRLRTRVTHGYVRGPGLRPGPPGPPRPGRRGRRPRRAATGSAPCPVFARWPRCPPGPAASAPDLAPSRLAPPGRGP